MKPKQIADLPKLKLLLRGHFLTGLLVALPFLVIGLILFKVLNALWLLQEWVPDTWRPGGFFESPAIAFGLNLLFTLILAFSLALGISILGWISKKWLGKKMLQLAEEVIQKIPVIRSIYSALDQLLRTMAPAGGSQQFNRVVYIEYPRKGVWALAFVTSSVKNGPLPSGCINVFIPTTPNPTSGFHLMVPQSEVLDANMKVEEAFKTIISLGIGGPAK